MSFRVFCGYFIRLLWPSAPLRFVVRGLDGSGWSDEGDRSRAGLVEGARADLGQIGLLALPDAGGGGGGESVDGQFAVR